MSQRSKICEILAIIIPVILISAFTMRSVLLQVPISGSEVLSPGLTITAETNQQSYLLREKVEIEGNVTSDESPASDLVVSTQIDNPLGTTIVCRTLQIGNPIQTWPINITKLFFTDTSNNPINTVQTDTIVKVGMTLYNWQSSSRDVFATITVFDANMVSLGTKIWSGTLDSHESATPKYSIYIPSWACSGKALVCGNAYSKEPRTGGIALSLENTTYFCISRTQEGLVDYPSLPPPPPQTTPGIYSTYITLPSDPTGGTYNVHVLGQDSPMTLHSASTTFNVEYSSGYPPQASFAYWPAAPYENMTVEFDASSSTPEGFNDTIIRYDWDFGDGTPKVIKEGTYENPPDPTTTHTYMEPNQRIITLNVTDNEGLWSTTSKPITIYPEFDPTANFTWVPETPIINETINFDASNSQPGWSETKGDYSPIVNFTWNFSDGTGLIIVSTPQTNHNFTQPGNYTVTLTVLDDVGRSDSAWTIIEILNVTLKDYDLTGDGKIDGRDLIIVARAYGSYPGHPLWNPIADLTGDDKVDGRDLILVSRHFGEDP